MAEWLRGSCWTPWQVSPRLFQLPHEWQDFSHRVHEAGHQPYCLVWL
ncbi:hypothetical protein ACFV8Z_16305 [Streptomyces sp. NPDC059837]|nr:hypothetical protein [Streptomyces sp. NBC_01764]MCX4400652.1 hypothetical protein [Streptomyces sp. NBC_01764]